MAAEVNDFGLVAHQKPGEVSEPNGPMRNQLQAVAVRSAPDLGIDCADLLVEGEFGRGREEEHLEHRNFHAVRVPLDMRVLIWINLRKQ
jgi:hypothetical protein